MANLLICHAGRTVGPYSAEEIQHHLAQGFLTLDTPAWTEGLIDWSTVSSVLALLARRPPGQAEPEYTRLSGRVLLPEGVAGFSWGAFLLAPVWCLGNRVWIGLLSFIPGLGQCVQLWLGFNGRELAWRKGSWRSVEHFASVQRRWTQGALAAWALLFVGLAALVFLQGGIPQEAPRGMAPLAGREPVLPEGRERSESLRLPASRADFERHLRDRSLAEVKAILGSPAFEREDKAKGVRLYVYRRITLQPGSRALDDLALVAFIGGQARGFQFLQEKRP